MEKPEKVRSALDAADKQNVPSTVRLFKLIMKFVEVDVDGLVADGKIEARQKVQIAHRKADLNRGFGGNTLIKAVDNPMFYTGDSCLTKGNPILFPVKADLVSINGCSFRLCAALTNNPDDEPVAYVEQVPHWYRCLDESTTELQVMEPGWTKQAEVWFYRPTCTANCMDFAKDGYQKGMHQ